AQEGAPDQKVRPDCERPGHPEEARRARGCEQRGKDQQRRRQKGS
ncbi:hypothetical protein BN1708_018998, partial [Verticillium longisporum]